MPYVVLSFEEALRKFKLEPSLFKAMVEGKPYAVLKETEVVVYNSYPIREKLKEKGFRYDPISKAWTLWFKGKTSEETERNRENAKKLLEELSLPCYDIRKETLSFRDYLNIAEAVKYRKPIYVGE